MDLKYLFSSRKNSSSNNGKLDSFTDPLISNPRYVSASSSEYGEMGVVSSSEVDSEDDTVDMNIGHTVRAKYTSKDKSNYELAKSNNIA